MFKLVTGIFQLLTCIFQLLTGIFKLSNWYIQVSKIKKKFGSPELPQKPATMDKHKQPNIQKLKYFVCILGLQKG